MKTCVAEVGAAVRVRAGNEPSRSFTITEKAPTRTATSAFTLKNLLRHYAKQALMQFK